MKTELAAHVGGRPSTAQRLLIDQAAQLKLHLLLMDRRMAAGGEFSERDGRQYLAWSNAFGRILRQIGMKAVAASPRSLAEHLAGRSRAAAS